MRADGGHVIKAQGLKRRGRGPREGPIGKALEGADRQTDRQRDFSSIIVRFWQCLINNGHALEVMLTMPVTEQDVIKSIT